MTDVEIFGFLCFFLSLDDAGMRWGVFASAEEILSYAIPAFGDVF